MALWNEVKSNGLIHGQMEDFYKLYGLYEIRSSCSYWIEDRLMCEQDQCMNTAALRFKEDLLQFTSHPQLLDYSGIVTASSHEALYSCFNMGIQKELLLIQNTVPLQNDPIVVMKSRLIEISQAIETFQQKVNQLGMEYEQMQIFVNGNSNIPTSPTQDKILEVYNSWYGNRTTLVGELRQIVANCKSLQTGVNNELKQWQRKQALAGNGAPFNDNLDAIQGVTEDLMGSSMKLLPIITTAQSIGGSPLDEAGAELVELANQVRSMQEQIIISSFIVEKQPPQVMKTNTKFAAKIRWLIGSALFQRHLNYNTPEVKCVIVSEAQAKLFCSEKVMPESGPSLSNDILGNSTPMDFQQGNRNFTAIFSDLQLKKIKRTEKKGTESVMDEKFALLFYTSAIVTDFKVRAWTLSLPAVVIVHGNQEPQSWATITWDNAFADIDREPFQVTDRVCWSHLSVALRTKFCAATGRALTDDNLQCIYEKFFSGEMRQDRTDYITWSQFCKELLPGNSFTFWDWFYAIMKLTKDHLLDLWQAGRIIGFISKSKTIAMLKQCEAGTFLLRFSDSGLGAVIVAVVDSSGTVFMIGPSKAKDFEVLPMANQILDSTWLDKLYPNKPKAEAFSKICKAEDETPTTKNGYVRTSFKVFCPLPQTSPSSSSSSVMQQTISNEQEGFGNMDLDLPLTDYNDLVPFLDLNRYQTM